MNTDRHKHRGGFTIIEMMVVITIMVILIAISFPMMWLIERDGRIAAGINTINVSSTAARAWAVQSKADDDSVSGANYSGVAILVGPADEIRLVQNHQQANGGALESAGLNGYVDIPGRDYIAIPKGVGLVGVKRNGTGNPTFIAPPFAIRFDENGKMVSGTANNIPAANPADSRTVHYDGDNNGTYGTGSGAARPSGYNPENWDGSDPSKWNNSVNKWNLRFEVIEAVSAVMVFNKFEYKDAGKKLQDGNNAQKLNDFGNNGGGKWIQENGRRLVFSRYTGNVIREGRIH